MVFQMVQHPLVEPVPGLDPVHDAHLRQAAADAALGIADIGAGLAAIAQCCQGIEHEAGIAQPAEAAVPVAFAARRLGERGGGRGDERARGCVGVQLEDESAARHHIPPGAAIAVIGDPLLPEGARHLLHLGGTVEGGALRQGVGGEHETVPPARLHHEPGGGGGAVHAPRRCAEEIGSTLRLHTLAGDPQLRVAAGEIRSRPPGHKQRHFALDPLDAADQPVGSNQAHTVVGGGGVAAAYRHVIHHRRPSPGREESGAQDVGAFHIGAPGLERAFGGDGEESALAGVQQPAAGGLGVVAGEAQPVHRAVAGDEGMAVAVSHQGVVADRGIAAGLRGNA